MGSEPCTTGMEEEMAATIMSILGVRAQVRGGTQATEATEATPVLIQVGLPEMLESAAVAEAEEIGTSRAICTTAAAAA